MELKIEYVPISDIKPYAGNAKLHPQEQIDQIKRSIKLMGFDDPIAIWKNGEIKSAFPDYFDATSGHLPMDCMRDIADEFYFHLHKTMPGSILLPTGSGETLVCLKMAFPKTIITAFYNMDAATQYEEDAPLNSLVGLLADNIIYSDAADYYSD